MTSHLNSFEVLPITQYFDKKLTEAMAEAAAGLYVAGEAVETAVQAGVGAYYVAKPTMPLRATFTQVSPATDESIK